MSTDDLRALAEAVKGRRHALGFARLYAAKLAGMSKDTWKRVEEAQPVRELNYAKIDRILGWATGSCLSIKAGGSPTPAQQSQTDPAVTLASLPGSDRRTKALRVVESASIGVTDLSAPEIRELSARIIDDLTREGIL